MFYQLILPGPSGKPITVPEPSGFQFTGSTKGNLGYIISELLKYVFPTAGLVLFFMLIAGGFQLLTSAGNPETTKKGYDKIIWAIIGFALVFVSYWLIQILEHIFGITIL